MNIYAIRIQSPVADIDVYEVHEDLRSVATKHRDSSRITLVGKVMNWADVQYDVLATETK